MYNMTFNLLKKKIIRLSLVNGLKYAIKGKVNRLTKYRTYVLDGGGGGVENSEIIALKRTPARTPASTHVGKRNNNRKH